MTLITKTVAVETGKISKNGFPIIVQDEGFYTLKDEYRRIKQIIFLYGFFEVLPTFTEIDGELTNIVNRIQGTETFQKSYTNANRRIDIDLETGEPIPAQEGDETAINGFKSIGVIDFHIKTVGQYILPDLSNTMVGIVASDEFKAKHNFDTMLL